MLRVYSSDFRDLDTYERYKKFLISLNVEVDEEYTFDEMMEYLYENPKERFDSVTAGVASQDLKGIFYWITTDRERLNEFAESRWIKTSSK